MRTDIAIHIKTGDTPVFTQNKLKTYPFRWVSNPSGLSRYIWGELEIPASLSAETISRGLACIIPYTAKYKEFYLRIKKNYGGSDYAYITNPTDGTEWYLVQVGNKNAFASELIKYSSSFEYVFVIDKGIVRLYANGVSDFEIKDANRQNMNMMLACNPTNNYRYPLTGVGVRSWVNSRTINSDMISVLRDEFNNDGTPVISAAYDFNTKKLNIELNTDNVD